MNTWQYKTVSILVIISMVISSLGLGWRPVYAAEPPEPKSGIYLPLLVPMLDLFPSAAEHVATLEQASQAQIWTLYLPLVVQQQAPIAVGQVDPDTGGEIAIPQADATLAFAPGAVTQTATIEYAALANPQGLPDEHTLVGQAVRLAARAGNQPTQRFLPQVSTRQVEDLIEYVVTNTVVITFAYSDAEVAGLDEGHLLIHTRSGGEWEPLLTVVDTVANVAAAPINHFSDFALLGVTAVPTATWVVLDPDHGGEDPGGQVTSPANYALEEKMVNLDTTLAVKNWLERCGVNVLMTRQDDSSVSAQWRANFIASAAPDAAATIGTNIATHSMANFVGGPLGLADFSKPADQAFAQTIVISVANTTQLPPTRGVHDARDWHGGLYLPTHVPGTLYSQIETAFLDSYYDRDRVIDPKLGYIAGGIYNGIISQLQLTACTPFSATVIDERAERSLGVNAWTRYSGQGVNPVTGNQFQWARDLFVPGTGLNVDIVRYYNSQSDEVGLFGRGWSSLYDMKVILLDDGVLQVKYADGHKARFTPGTEGYQADAGVFDTLTVEGGNYVLTTPDQIRFSFDNTGKLQSIADEIGSTIRLHYGGGSLDWIEDTTGRHFEVDTAAGLVTRIADPAGRAVTYSYGTRSLVYTQYLQALRRAALPVYAQQAAGTWAMAAGTDLLSMTDARGGNPTQYEYDPAGGGLSRITDPESMNYLDNVYTPDGRVSEQKNAKGDSGTWDYDIPNMQATYTDAEGNKTIYYFDSKYRVIKEEDALGQTTLYEYDAGDNITAMTDKRGNTWRYTYDERGNMLTRSDPLDQWSLYDSDVTTWAYDDKNNVTNMTDALGNETAYEYDDKGNPTKVTEPNGAETLGQYDDKGQMTWLRDAEGRETSFEYDDHGNRTKTLKADGGWTASTFDDSGHELTRIECLNPPACTQTRTTTNEYDGNGNVTKTIDPMGQATTFEYDGNNMLKKKVDRRGGVWEYDYDENLNPTWEKDPLGRVNEYTYNKMDRRLTAEDPMGRLTKFEYDKLYRLTKVINPKNDEYTYDYDPNGNLLTLTDPLGQQTSFVYDVTNRRKFIHDAIGGTTEYCYDPLDRIIRVFDPRRAETNFYYDSVGNMDEVVDPLGNMVRLGYDKVHNRVELTEGIPPKGDGTDGRTSRFEFDSLNRQIAATDPLSRTTRVEYDGVDNVIATTDAMGNTTRAEYNLNGWLTRQVDPLNGEITYEYDAEGANTAFTDALDHTTRYEYDLAGQMLKVTDPLNAETAFEYDWASNQISVTDAAGHVTNYKYDALNLMTQETDPLSRVTKYEYDELRRMTARTDANGLTTRYAYNPLGWLLGVTDALSQTNHYEYDAVGNRTAIIDANGITTTFEYNFLNQLMREINPLDKTWQYSYDANGNMIRRVDDKWQATYYEYDKANQLVATVYGIGARANLSVMFEYDDNGNEVAMHDWNGDWSYTYDELNRRTSATDYNGRTLSWDYDAAGNRTSMTYPDGHQVGMTYDANNRLDTLQDAQNRTVDWGYDPLGYITSQVNPNGTNTTYIYDAAQQLIALSNQGPGAVAIATYNYTLDKVGNRTRVIEQRGAASVTRDYSYDKLYRLTRAQTNTGQDMAYVYDPVGNRTVKAGLPEPGSSLTATQPVSLSYSYNALNAMLHAGPSEFAYDDNGNRVRKTEPLTATQYASATAALNLSGTLVTTYTYDYENRMTAVEEAISSTAGLSVTMRAWYTYDGYGRRVEKLVTRYSLTETFHLPLGEGQGEGQTLTRTLPLTTSLLHREYVFDGLEPVAEYDYVDGAITPTLVSHYTYGNGRMVLMERTENGQAKSYWYHYDGLGSVVALTDETGAEACKWKYDEYGNVLDGCPELNHYTYTGQEYDAETELMHFFARYYDAETGVWIAQDTYRGQQDMPFSLHRYAYGLDNPALLNDEYGYCPWCIVAIVAVVVVLTVVDYAWTAYDAYQDTQIIADENASELEKEVATTDLYMTAAFELAEPDEEEPINPGTVPADDILRKLAKKELREKLLKEAMERGIRLTKEEMEEKLIKEGFEKGSKELAQELSNKMAKQAAEKIAKDPNKINHIFENVAHNWAKAGVKNSDDGVKLIQEVVTDNYNIIDSKAIGEAFEISKEFSGGYKVVVKGVKNKNGLFDIGTAWVN